MIRYTIPFLVLVLLPVVIASPRRASCVSDDDCKGKLSCLGKKTKKCIMKMGRGKKCGTDPYWVCQDELVCEDEICKVPVAGECTLPGSVCVDGVACVGNDKVKKCFMPKPEGKRCGLDPFWVCRGDLVCESSICKTPIGGDCSVRKAECVKGSACIGDKCMKVVGRGRRCGKKRACKKRFMCAGDTGKTICVIPGKPGRECGQFDTCRDSTCVEDKCVA